MEIRFEKYKKLIDHFVHGLSTYGTEAEEDLRSQGYLMFCEALKGFDESKGFAFSTYLMNHLYRLYRYFKKEMGYQRGLEFQDVQDYYEDTTNEQGGGHMVIDEALFSYDTFVETLERVESLVVLSQDAKSVLAYILKMDYYIPGMRYKPFKSSTAEWFKQNCDWARSKTLKAWEELKVWWVNEPFMETV